MQVRVAVVSMERGSHMNNFRCIIISRGSGMSEGSIWSSCVAASIDVKARLSKVQSIDGLTMAEEGPDGCVD